MSGCMNNMGRVTDVGGGLSGCGKHVEVGNPDVSSTRYNSIPILQTYSKEVLSSGVGVVVRQVDRLVLENERWGGFSGVYTGSA